MANPKLTLHRAALIVDSPTPYKLRIHEYGAIVMDPLGLIKDVGPALKMKKLFPSAKIVDHGPTSVITPGFVDAHTHAPQLEIVASSGHTLLDWLNHYAFPAETRYGRVNYAAPRYREFCRSLLRCGTTSAAIYGTSHTATTLKLMEAAHHEGLRAQVGKVLMDRNAPDTLAEPADKALKDLERIILKFRKNKKVRPIITIRFAPTSTLALLKGAGELKQKYPETFVQTHLSETKEEIEWVKKLFPSSKNYTDVYAKHGLLDDKTLLGHCIYLEPDEIKTLQRTQSHLVHCPSSNLFLGSGLFPYEDRIRHGLSVALGSDVGGGWEPSMQATLRAAYEVQALQKYFMKASELLYLATYAGTRALGQDAYLGLFEKNYAGDFVVHDYSLSPILKQRMARAESPESALSALLLLGDETTIKATYIDGEAVYARGL